MVHGEVEAHGLGVEVRHRRLATQLGVIQLHIDIVHGQCIGAVGEVAARRELRQHLRVARLGRSDAELAHQLAAAPRDRA